MHLLLTISVKKMYLKAVFHCLFNRLMDVFNIQSMSLWSKQRIITVTEESNVLSVWRKLTQVKIIQIFSR